jgi:hypothetical protein
MASAEFHRRWAARLLGLALKATNAATGRSLRLMAADSLEKAEGTVALDGKPGGTSSKAGGEGNSD